MIKFEKELPQITIRPRRYLIGVGSNIDPTLNVPKAIDLLRTQAERCITSRAIQTEPIGMISDYSFCNLVVYLETQLDPSALKMLFNNIEAALGRDRSDPNRKIKDRPIDLDILREIKGFNDYYQTLIESPDYCHPILHELLGTLLYSPSSLGEGGLNLSMGNLQFGIVPSDITPVNLP